MHGCGAYFPGGHGWVIHLLTESSSKALYVLPVNNEYQANMKVLVEATHFC